MTAPEEEPTAADPAASTSDDASVGKFLYRLALAGVGGLILAQEEISSRFRRPEDGDDESEEGPAAGDSAEAEGDTTQVEATIDKVLHTLNLPNRAEVEELNRVVDELTAKVEALGKDK